MPPASQAYYFHLFWTAFNGTLVFWQQVDGQYLLSVYLTKEMLFILVVALGILLGTVVAKSVKTKKTSQPRLPKYHIRRIEL